MDIIDIILDVAIIICNITVIIILVKERKK